MMNMRSHPLGDPLAFCEDELALDEFEHRPTILKMRHRAGEIVDGLIGEVMFMRWIPEGVWMGKVWGQNLDTATRLSYPTGFPHRPDDVVEVLDGIVKEHFVENTIAKGPRGALEVCDNVNSRGRTDVNSDCPRNLGFPATDVKDSASHGATLCRKQRKSQRVLSEALGVQLAHAIGIVSVLMWAGVGQAAESTNFRLQQEQVVAGFGSGTSITYADTRGVVGQDRKRYRVPRGHVGLGKLFALYANPITR